MKKTKGLFVLCLICVFAGFLTLACQKQATEEADQSAFVTLERRDAGYFYGEIDLSQMTHSQMGEEYAKAIVATFPDYEKHIDSLLKDQFDLLAAAKDVIGYDLNFALCLTRATAIKGNLQPEYQDEIAGLLTIFNYDQDILGDGRLSQDEMLVFQLFGDVMRPTQCFWRCRLRGCLGHWCDHRRSKSGLGLAAA